MLLQFLIGLEFRSRLLAAAVDDRAVVLELDSGEEILARVVGIGWVTVTIDHVVDEDERDWVATSTIPLATIMAIREDDINRVRQRFEVAFEAEDDVPAQIPPGL